MLEYIFGSRERAALIKYFVSQPPQPVNLKQLKRAMGGLRLKQQLLVELEKLGLIKRFRSSAKWVWQLEPDFPLVAELRALLFKSLIALSQSLSRRLQLMNGLQGLVFSGLFIDRPELPTDVLVIGNVDRRALKREVSRLSVAFNQELRFTHLTRPEFQQRRRLADKFLYEVLNNKPVVVIDKLSL